MPLIDIVVFELIVLRLLGRSLDDNGPWQGVTKLSRMTRRTTGARVDLVLTMPKGQDDCVRANGDDNNDAEGRWTAAPTSTLWG